MAETYGRYDLAMGCRRTAASPSYEIGRRATGGGSETGSGPPPPAAEVLDQSIEGLAGFTQPVAADDPRAAGWAPDAAEGA
jgi:hypothetical protein